MPSCSFAALGFLRPHVGVIDKPKASKTTKNRKQTAQDHENWSSLKRIIQQQTDYQKNSDAYSDLNASAK
jgi:hypothetical protein